MRSVSDIYRELGCSRNTIYPIIEAAEVEPTLEGLAKMFTDEQFQKIQEVYYRKYPNRKRKGLVKEQSSLFKVDSDDQTVEVISSKKRFVPVEEVYERDRKIFLMRQERDAETITDLRKQLEGKDRIIDSLLEIIKNQNTAVPKQVTTTSTQRTSPMFPEHDPNVDTLTGDLFNQPKESESSAQNPPAPEIPRGTYEVIRQHVKPPSWQPSAFPDDMIPIDADEAVLQFFKGRIPQRTTDFDGLIVHMERVGFPQVSTGALSSRITKLRKQQQAERKARDQLKQV
jgi:hypothetical protein